MMINSSYSRAIFSAFVIDFHKEELQDRTKKLINMLIWNQHNVTAPSVISIVPFFELWGGHAIDEDGEALVSHRDVG